LTKAKEIFLDVVKNAPPPEEYGFSYEDETGIYIKFWDQNRFMHYVAWMEQFQEKRNRQVVWIHSVYPKSFYYLGFICLEQSDTEGAIAYLDKGALLEPTNPQFTLEKAQVFLQRRDYDSASKLYDQISELGPHTSPHDLAVALQERGLSTWNRIGLTRRRPPFANHCALTLIVLLLPMN
jgi:tetratricopeptide (TPR) repeat protein